MSTNTNKANLKPFTLWDHDYVWTYDLREEGGSYPGFTLHIVARDEINVDAMIGGTVDNGAGYGDAAAAERLGMYWRAIRTARKLNRWGRVYASPCSIAPSLRLEWRYQRDEPVASSSYYGPFIKGTDPRPNEMIDTVALLTTLARYVDADRLKNGHSVDHVLGDMDTVLDTLERLKMPRITALPTNVQLGTPGYNWSEGWRDVTTAERQTLLTLRMRACPVATGDAQRVREWLQEHPVRLA